MSRLSRRVVLVAVLLVLAGIQPAAAGPSGDQAFDEGLQWGLAVIGAPEAWTSGRGAGITIAIVDSGVRTSHADLKGKIDGGVACIDTGGDQAKCSGPPVDDDGHGTHVAGIAAATTDNGIGIAGTAPDARILAVKVLSTSCSGNDCETTGNASDVSAGIRWAVDNGADIINLSLGSTTDAVLGPSFADAVDYAWDRGSIAVVAAGNDFVLNSGFSNQPAVVVTATDRSDRAATYSNGVGRAKWAVAAPGGESNDTATSCASGGTPQGVLSTWGTADEAYACLAGTSMAAPHVAGALAVLRGLGLSPQAAVDTLLDTAVDLGLPGRDDDFGEGRIDLAAAAATVSPATTTVPSTTSVPTSVTTTTLAPAPTTTVAPSTSATTAAPAPTTAAPTPTTTPPSTIDLATPPSLGGGSTSAPPPVTTGETLASGLSTLAQEDDGPARSPLVIGIATLGVLGTGAATGSSLLRARKI